MPATVLMRKAHVKLNLYGISENQRQQCFCAPCVYFCSSLLLLLPPGLFMQLLLVCVSRQSGVRDVFLIQNGWWICMIIKIMVRFWHLSARLRSCSSLIDQISLSNFKCNLVNNHNSNISLTWAKTNKQKKKTVSSSSVFLTFLMFQL